MENGVGGKFHFKKNSFSDVCDLQRQIMTSCEVFNGGEVFWVGKKCDGNNERHLRDTPQLDNAQWDVF